MFLSIGGDWLISGAYLLSALLCAVAAVVTGRRPDGSTGTGRLVWLLLALGLTTVVMLQLFDVQQVVAKEGREAARSEGLYLNRRDIQAAIIALVVIGLTSVVSYVGLAFRGRSYRLPLVAVILLGGFLAVRAISLHQIDALLYGQTLGGATWNDLLEGALVLVIGLSAARSFVKVPR